MSTLRLGPLALAAALLVALPARAAPTLRHTRLLDVELAAAPEPLPAASVVETPVRRSVAWAFVPFGIGQYANGQTIKGTLFCVAEVLAFATAAVSLGAFESNKIDGAFLKWGQFKDPARAQKLQTAYLVAFWSGVALAAIGVADALIFRPSPETELQLAPSAVALRF